MHHSRFYTTEPPSCLECPVYCIRARLDGPPYLSQPPQGKHQDCQPRWWNRCQVCSSHMVWGWHDTSWADSPTNQAPPQELHGLKLVIKEEAVPQKDQPKFPALAFLAERGLLAPDAWNCKRNQVSLKATIDVPMLGTIIETNGDRLDDSHMPIGWPLFIDGAVRQCCVHRNATVQDMEDMLQTYDLERHSVEINRKASQWSHNAVWNRKYMEPKQKATMGRVGNSHRAQNVSLLWHKGQWHTPSSRSHRKSPTSHFAREPVSPGTWNASAKERPTSECNPDAESYGRVGAHPMWK